MVRCPSGYVTAASLTLAIASAPIALGGPPSQVQVPSSIEDFFQPGTQPDPTGGDELAPFIAARSNCINCHSEYLPTNQEPYDGWIASAMGQSARDPIWHAALTIANQDSADAGEFCIRCHAPAAWLSGRSLPADASGFIDTFSENDFEGVTCHFCHRAVNPVLEGDSPIEDVDILANLEFPVGSTHGNGRFVIDPNDVRRGPYLDIALDPNMNLHGTDVIYSPYHSRSDLCGSCHDVRNPMFMRQPDGSYALTNLDEPHPTQDPYDMYPEQTTFSEWQFSQFANGGVAFPDGRFGGAHPTGVMESCQDCHMPDQVAGGCFAWQFPPFFQRPDLPEHTFTGSNYWLMRLLRSMYDDSFTGLSEDAVLASEARTAAMLRAASDTLATQVGGQLKVRVVNYSGHKLPTGYPEGRRVWVNVKFFDSNDVLIDEAGAYDYASATLDSSDTTVYETIHEITDEVAALTNLPPGAEFHLALNGAVSKDNRIPPVGFVNAEYEMMGAPPIGEVFADGQHWHDTMYDIPKGATEAVVTLYYQVMTREYAEFLRDKNVTNGMGQAVYDGWADPAVGNKVPPVDMDTVVLGLAAPVPGDADRDGDADFDDLIAVLVAWGPCPPPDLCDPDLDCDGDIDFNDLITVLASWS